MTCTRCRAEIPNYREYSHDLNTKDGCLSRMGDYLTFCDRCARSLRGMVGRWLDRGTPAAHQCGCLDRERSLAYNVHRARTEDRPDFMKYWPEHARKDAKGIATCAHEHHAAYLATDPLPALPQWIPYPEDPGTKYPRGAE